MRVEDLFRTHPFEPIVTGIELTHMIEAEPAPMARPVKTAGTMSGRTEFPGISATWRFALPVFCLMTTVKP